MMNSTYIAQNSMYTLSSLFFHACILALITTMGYQVYQTSKIARQAALLRRFRALGDNISIFLLDNLDSKELTNDDKLELRKILHNLESIVQYFDQARASFTYSRVAGVLFAPSSIKASVQEQVSENPVMNPIRAEIAHALFYAIAQHIPFFRFRIIMYLLKPLCGFVLRASHSKLINHSWLKRTKQVVEELQLMEKQKDYYVQLCHVNE